MTAVNKSIQSPSSSSSSSSFRVTLPVSRATKAAEDQCSECNSRATTSSPLLSCARCHRVSYCGKVCQKKHWTLHKVQCRTTIRDTVSSSSASSSSSSSSSSPSSSSSDSLSKLTSLSASASDAILSQPDPTVYGDHRTWKWGVNDAQDEDIIVWCLRRVELHLAQVGTAIDSAAEEALCGLILHLYKKDHSLKPDRYLDFKSIPDMEKQRYATQITNLFNAEDFDPGRLVDDPHRRYYEAIQAALSHPLHIFVQYADQWKFIKRLPHPHQKWLARVTTLQMNHIHSQKHGRPVDWWWEQPSM